VRKSVNKAVAVCTTTTPGGSRRRPGH